MQERETPERAKPAGPANSRSHQRRAYRAPRLIEYGSVAKLTQGTLSRSSDGPMGGFSMIR